ncbi:2-dehydropantoate 2-reductase [Endozoicomonas sp. 4G]|uniref:ketopantoate reductase family protein n=1 Tax=Endozoicomonas sp. 4G TaxID=2872754 RepID=UPI0020784FF3|nr:2-dehydropantoate 2-reductase [Endozoicomonas sp. 4G]
MTWHIIGAGSMGCLWTAQLLKAGMKATLLVREQRLRSLNIAHNIARPILTVDEWDGATHRYPIKLNSPESLTDSITHLLVCTKAQDAEAAVQSLAGQLSDQCQILLMQNGMGSQQAIARQFCSQTVWAASTTEGAWMKDALHVCHAGSGSTWVGPVDQEPDDSVWQALKGVLEQLPLDIQFTHQIEQKLWDKLAINCAINGLTALYDCRNGELLNSKERQQRLAALTEEVTQVRQSAGVPGSGNLLELVHQVCRDTAMNHSSTCMDARRGRDTELAFINGYLIEQAEKLGVETPANRRLMKALTELNIR